MTRLESRPAPLNKFMGQGLWEYVFFVDIEGHSQEDAVARAINAMKKEASFLKVIGAYPQSPRLD